MSIRFICESCAKKMALDDKFAGKRILCPNCRQPIKVPTESLLSPVSSGAQGSSQAASAHSGGSVSSAPVLSPTAVANESSQIDILKEEAFAQGVESGSSDEIISVSRTKIVNADDYLVEGHVSMELGLDGVQEFLEALRKAPPVLDLKPSTLRRMWQMVLAASEAFVVDIQDKGEKLLLRAKVSHQRVELTVAALGRGNSEGAGRVESIARHYRHTYDAKIAKGERNRSLMIEIPYKNFDESIEDSVEMSAPLFQRESDETTGRTRFYMDISSKRLWPQLGRLREECGEMITSLGIEDLTSMQVQLAVDEMITNAIVHGNCRVASSSDGTGKRDPNFTKNIEKALSNPAAGKKRVHMLLEHDWTGISVMISDEGAGFDVRKIVDGYADDQKRQHGRGIPLVRKIADRYRYTSGGRCVWFHVSTHRKPPTAPLAEVEVED